MDDRSRDRRVRERRVMGSAKGRRKTGARCSMVLGLACLEFGGLIGSAESAEWYEKDEFITERKHPDIGTGAWALFCES